MKNDVTQGTCEMENEMQAFLLRLHFPYHCFHFSHSSFSSSFSVFLSPKVILCDYTFLFSPLVPAEQCFFQREHLPLVPALLCCLSLRSFLKQQEFQECV